MPKEDLNFLYADGHVTQHILTETPMNQTLFTGSSAVAERLVIALKGKVSIEDAGFDWKILGPDVPQTEEEIDYVAWQAENDCFGHTGQKCSA